MITKFPILIRIAAKTMVRHAITKSTPRRGVPVLFQVIRHQLTDYLARLYRNTVDILISSPMLMIVDLSTIVHRKRITLAAITIDIIGSL